MQHICIYRCWFYKSASVTWALLWITMHYKSNILHHHQTVKGKNGLFLILYHIPKFCEIFRDTDYLLLNININESCLGFLGINSKFKIYNRKYWKIYSNIENAQSRSWILVNYHLSRLERVPTVFRNLTPYQGI